MKWYHYLRKRNNKSLLLIISFLFFQLGCYKRQQQELNFTKRATYDLRINYKDSFGRHTSIYYNNQISKDSLYIFFETGFNNDIVSLYVDNELFYCDSIKTINQLGYAEHFVLGNKVRSLGIRVNGGALGYLEIPKRVTHNIFNVNYFDSLLVLSVLDNAPFYD